MIVVDYLQLVEVEDIKMPRELQISTITRRLANLAKEIGCVALVACQVNRDWNVKEGPKLKNLRESGSIEQHASRVIFTWRPEKDMNKTEQKVRNDYQQQLIQAKHRDGPKGYSWVVFHAPYTKFQDVPPPGSRGRPKKEVQQEILPGEGQG